MALQANIILDLNKKNTTNPRVTLRQSDQNYPSITVQVTENGQPFNGTGWEAAFEGMTSGGFFVHDSSHFDKSSTPATGTYTYVPPLQVSSDIGSFELAYFVFEKAGSPKQRTTTANFRFDIIEQADIDADVADDYVSTWQSADEKMKALQKEMEDAAAAYKKIVDGYVNEFNGKVAKINGDITAAEKRITDMVNNANAALQNILKSNNTFTGTNTFNNQVFINDTATIHQIELMNAAPYIDFHAKNSTADYTSRLIDAGEGLYANPMIPAGMPNSLVIHEATDENPLNVDTMIGGIPALPGLNYNATVRIAGGAKPLTGILPTNNGTWSILENIPQSGSNALQRFTDTLTGKIYTRTIDGSKWQAWHAVAKDDLVVHNTGNERVSGNKTFNNQVFINDTATIHQIELMNAAPYIDFHGLNTTDDFTSRLLDKGTGLLAISNLESSHIQDLSIHLGTDEKPINVDTLVGGVPALEGNPGIHARVVFGGGSNGIQGTLPSGAGNMTYSILENMGGNYNSVRAQRWTDFTTNRTYTRTFSGGGGGSWSAWKTLAQNEDVVHNTGNETVTGDKTFTGVTDIQHQKQYKASFTIGKNTIKLTRIGQVVYVNATTTEQINGANSHGAIPAGFTPANDSVINYIRGSDQGSCLFQAVYKSIWFPITVNIATNMSGSYLTNDVLPSH